MNLRYANRVVWQHLEKDECQDCRGKCSANQLGNAAGFDQIPGQFQGVCARCGSCAIAEYHFCAIYDAGFDMHICSSVAVNPDGVFVRFHLHGRSPGLRVKVRSLPSRANGPVVLSAHSPLTVAGAADELAPDMGPPSRHSQFDPRCFASLMGTMPNQLCRSAPDSSRRIPARAHNRMRCTAPVSPVWRLLIGRVGGGRCSLLD